MADQEQTRFRSFAERYVIERASGFKSDTDAWTAVQDAMRIYRMIEQQSGRVHPQADDAQQAGVGQQALQTSPWAAPLSPLNPAPGSPEWTLPQAMPILAASQIVPPDKKSRVRQLFNWTMNTVRKE